MKTTLTVCTVALLLASGFLVADDDQPKADAKAEAKSGLKKAFINGEGPGWKTLSLPTSRMSTATRRPGRRRTARFTARGCRSE